MLMGCAGLDPASQTGEARLLLEQVDARSAILKERELALLRREKRVQEAEQTLLRQQDPDGENEAIPVIYPLADRRRFERLFPPLHPDEGSCYALGWLPPQQTSEPLELTLQDAHQQFVHHPAEFERVTESVVMVEDTRPDAKLREERVSLVLRPAWTEYRIQAAGFETIQETHATGREETHWQICQPDASNSLRDLASQYCPQKTVSELHKSERQVLVEEAGFETVEHPAITQELTVLKAIETTDPSYASTQEFSVQRLLAEARLESQSVAARTQTLAVSHTEIEARLAWILVSCADVFDKGSWRDVQKALNARGYPVGEITGKPDRLTVEALAKFQVDQGLALTSPHVSIEALEALDIH